MKNEALRLLLAITALIFTALLANPRAELEATDPGQVHMADKNEAAPSDRSPGQEKRKLKANRSFAFFYRR